MKLYLFILIPLLLTFTHAKTIKSFYADGTIKSAITYKDGKKNGVEHIFYEDGATLKVANNYVYGRLHGLQQRYSQDALLIQEENYQQGRLDGLSRYYRNGLLQREVEYMNGMVDGTYREFFPSGMRKLEIVWRRDKAVEGYWYTEEGTRSSMSAKAIQNLKPSDIPGSSSK